MCAQVPVNLDRHVQCEKCEDQVSGGYEFSTCQVVQCENVIKAELQVCNSLGHELVHAFDKCRAKIDEKNIDHLACTEVRAANLMHCNLLSAWGHGQITPFDYHNKHQACVRTKAIKSIRTVRDIGEQAAIAAVDKVFTRCYNDLEPFGRRIKLGAQESAQALRDGIFYGYLPLPDEDGPGKNMTE
ncbi:mitochondrial inner membrane protease ATP23 homolog isoform X2 [Mya arenaria]|uniref:mitochondrial inner membrane protease ATP23 homolog isoform X2 n=1 Tax=Mya arenaria TaxID=6604 RepID=UPI0022E980A8|nr:mitochondrial inner membrane protease ATP23 homolog isoform X2 [Mya arenaria]